MLRDYYNKMFKKEEYAIKLVDIPMKHQNTFHKLRNTSSNYLEKERFVKKLESLYASQKCNPHIQERADNTFKYIEYVKKVLAE